MKNINKYFKYALKVSFALLGIYSSSFASNFFRNDEIISFQNRSTGYMLDTREDMDKEGDWAANVYTLEDNGGDHQRWRVKKTGNYYKFQNVATNSFLDSDQGHVYAIGGNDGSHQKWAVRLDNNYFLFENAQTHQFLDSNIAKKVYARDYKGANYYQMWIIRRH